MLTAIGRIAAATYRITLAHARYSGTCPQNGPFPFWGYGPPRLIYGSLGPPESTSQTGSAMFALLLVVTNRRHYVCSSRLHLVHGVRACDAMRPNDNTNTTRHIRESWQFVFSLQTVFELGQFKNSSKYACLPDFSSYCMIPIYLTS